MTCLPLVTVCIPSYNHGRLLPDAIESVLAQSYEVLECLIFDDGSTDGSWEIALTYQARDERVRLLSHAERANRGIPATLNAAYGRARGEYVLHFAADDILLPDSIARRVEPFQRDPRVGFVYGRIEMLDAEGRPTGDYGGVAPEAICRFDATDDPLQALLLHCYIPSPTVLVRRDVLSGVGEFSTSVYYSDWELWIRLMAHGARPAFVDGEALVGCRPGAYGDDADLPRRLELFRALSSTAESADGRLQEPRIRALLSLQRALQAAQLGLEEEARVSIDSAFGLDPGLRSDPGYLSWWLGPVQRRRPPSAEASGAFDWVARLSDLGASQTAVISAGGRAGVFGCWAVDAMLGELRTEVVDTLQWALIGNELEHGGARVRPRILCACGMRALRRPALLRERWFVKSLLCAAGLWSIATRARRWWLGGGLNLLRGR
jgi:glycosyltransferase involved in cell wall biosynthesis